MDFAHTSEQQEAADLARRILGDRCTQQRLREVEAGDARYDPALWQEIGAAGLVGLGLPEEDGGAGLGLLELCSVLVETGRTVAPVPLATHATSAMAIRRFGTPAQRREWLPDAAAGRTVLTAALSEDRADVPERPATTAEPEPSPARSPGGPSGDRQAGDGPAWRLSGTKCVVVSGTVADLFLVPADPDHGGPHRVPLDHQSGHRPRRVRVPGQARRPGSVRGRATGERRRRRGQARPGRRRPRP